MHIRGVTFRNRIAHPQPPRLAYAADVFGSYKILFASRSKIPRTELLEKPPARTGDAARLGRSLGHAYFGRVGINPHALCWIRVTNSLWLRDLRYGGLHGSQHNPGFTVTVVAVLGLGIGA